MYEIRSRKSEIREMRKEGKKGKKRIVKKKFYSLLGLIGFN